MRFTIRIADVNIGINSVYDEVRDLCSKYIYNEDTAYEIEPEVAFEVAIIPEDIAFEREKAKSEAQFEQRPHVDFVDTYPDSYLETLAVYRKIAEKLLDFDTLLMHGVALGLDGAAYLFTGPSGIGKTTHARFWCETYPDAFIINGDKPLIKVTDNGATVYGTPWAGKEGTNRNVSMPLRAICFVSRGEKNRIEPADFNDLFPLLIGQTYRPADEKSTRKTLELIKKLSENMRFYTLFCNPDAEAARIAKEGMQE